VGGRAQESGRAPRSNNERKTIELLRKLTQK
jgi:hypothetical protein